MMKVISRLRIFRAAGAPCVAMSATATSEEVSSIISNLGLRTAPVILKASPTQKHIKVSVSFIELKLKQMAFSLVRILFLFSRKVAN